MNLITRLDIGDLLKVLSLEIELHLAGIKKQFDRQATKNIELLPNYCHHDWQPSSLWENMLHTRVYQNSNYSQHRDAKIESESGQKVLLTKIYPS